MSECDKIVDVVIGGGGIAGLALAYRLSVVAPDLRVVLLESSDRVGGKASTELIAHDDGEFLIEAGPDSFLAAKPWAHELANELGLGDRLIPLNSMQAPVGVLKHGRWVDLPQGVALIAPTRLRSLIGSDLIGWRGKARAALDLALPAHASDDDESLGSLVRRRLGREVLDWIAEPLAAGIYNADPEKLSVTATMPHLLTAERAHGSLIRGLRSANRATTKRPASTFLSFRGGMQELVDGLVERIGDRCRTRMPITGIEFDRERILVQSDEQSISAQHVVLALPAATVSTLLAPIAPEAANEANLLRTLSAGTLSLAIRERDVPRPLPGYGLVVPRLERRPFNAVTIASSKFDGRAPAGWSLVRLFFGGFRTPQTFEMDDDRIIAEAMAFLRELIGMEGKPAAARILRWPNGSPQFDVGHLERVHRIENALPAGISVLGSSFAGAGIPDIVRNADITAERLTAILTSGGSRHFDPAAIRTA